ncbi:hypothetical protein MMC30_002693 [Trapelia coarctata]|nr:hypothetical protein [Trapelia coarctata]
MESNSDGSLHRTPSRTSSTTSSRSCKSEFVRKPRKPSSGVSSPQTTPTTAATDRSLTSFPSLSPELNSPISTRESRYKNSLSPGEDDATPRKPVKNKASIVESLTAKSPSFRARSSIFEDSPTSATQHVPGALHYASDEHIKRLVSRTGAVALVRQLAEDLAQRDAEMTAFRRRAEQRERELKKMLREVEVSNLDIETRLHHLDNATQGDRNAKDDSKGKGQNGVGGKKDTTTRDDIHEMLGEAIKDDLDLDGGIEEDYMDTLERQGTVRAKTSRSQDVDGASTNSSMDAPDKPSGTTRGWKDYLWSNTATSRRTSRASTLSEADEAFGAARARATSGAVGRRKGLNEALFQPPRRTSNIEEEVVIDTADADRKSEEKSRASSMTSWTLKLFAGNPQTSRESENHDAIRGRSVTAGNGTVQGPRTGSLASVMTASSAKASLMKVSSKSSGSQPVRKNFQPLNLGPNGTLKSSSQSTHSLPPGSPSSVDTAANFGPVEMDTILPHGSRPPTLTPSYQNIDDTTDYLTDRFGFIYDQRRRKKEAEAFANRPQSKISKSKDTVKDQHPGRPETPVSIDDREEEKSVKKWQDYLKIATFPTELLSHTPTSGTFMKVANADIKASLKRSPTFEGVQEDAPSLSPNPIPSASSVTAANAEIAKPSIVTPGGPTAADKSDMEPVRLLLAKLTEQHDSLQQVKTVKWNEFLRKIRAERRKEGETASAIDSRSQQAIMPEVSLADGEIIGIATLGSKGKTGRAKYKEFKSLVLAGVPVVHRPKVWAECSGASALRIPGYYEDLIMNGVDDPIILAQIQMDINRTLTDNVYFRKGPGVVKLNQVLLAYSRRNPEVGYCQGMNLITASLLLIMPTAEDAFWILVSIIENILPRHYYDNSLLTSRADQQVLRQYVSDLLPGLSAHLDDLGIELEALTFQWFLSLFTDCLSAETLYRVWDVLLCCKDEDGNGGSTFLFQVALALLKINEGQLIACAAPGEVYAYLGGEITNHSIPIDGLIRASEGLKGLIRRAEVEERRAKWVAFEKETIEEREKIRQEGSGTKASHQGE